MMTNSSYAINTTFNKQTSKQQIVAFKRELETINYVVNFRMVPVEVFSYMYM